MLIEINNIKPLFINISYNSKKIVRENKWINLTINIKNDENIVK